MAKFPKEIFVSAFLDNLADAYATLEDADNSLNGVSEVYSLAKYKLVEEGVVESQFEFKPKKTKKK